MSSLLFAHQMLITVKDQESIEESVHLCVTDVFHRAAQSAERVGEVGGVGANSLRCSRQLLHDGEGVRQPGDQRRQGGTCGARRRCRLLRVTNSIATCSE